MTEPANPSSPPGAHFFLGVVLPRHVRMLLACVLMALALGIAFH